MKMQVAATAAPPLVGVCQRLFFGAFRMKIVLERHGHRAPGKVR